MLGGPWCALLTRERDLDAVDVVRNGRERHAQPLIDRRLCWA